MSRFFTSPNYWEYNLQQIYEGDVQNPQKGTFTNPCWTSTIWGFHKIGIPLNHPFVEGCSLVNQPFCIIPHIWWYGMMGIDHKHLSIKPFSSFLHLYGRLGDLTASTTGMLNIGYWAFLTGFIKCDSWNEQNSTVEYDCYGSKSKSYSQSYKLF